MMLSLLKLTIQIWLFTNEIQNMNIQLSPPPILLVLVYCYDVLIAAVNLLQEQSVR